jgi:hypothetical protein
MAISIFDLKIKDLFSISKLGQVKTWDAVIAVWLILVMIFGNFWIGFITFVVWDILYYIVKYFNTRMTALEDLIKEQSK